MQHPPTYLVDALATAERAAVTLSELCREVSELTASIGPLAPVLPGSTLVGNRVDVTFTDWHATTEYSRPVLMARFDATVNGRSYSHGSATCTPMRAPDDDSGVQYRGIYERCNGLSFTFRTSEGLTDSARTKLEDVTLAHYRGMISADEVRQWGTVADALSTVRREYSWYVSDHKVTSALREARTVLGLVERAS